MSKELLARRQKAEDSFNKLVQDREAKQAEINAIDAELNRLQGEYRLVNELLDGDKKVSKEADKIDATKVEGA